MEIRKKLGAKKAEKSFEISAFLVFSRSDLNRPKNLAYHSKSIHDIQSADSLIPWQRWAQKVIRGLSDFRTMVANGSR